MLNIFHIINERLNSSGIIVGCWGCIGNRYSALVIVNDIRNKSALIVRR